MELRYSSMSDERLKDLDGTADELFIMARNGYIEDIEQLEAIRDILGNPVEGKEDKARLVSYMVERERNDQDPNVDTSLYNIGQMKMDFLDGISEIDELEIEDGLYLTIVPDRDDVLMSLSCYRDGEEGGGGNAFLYG